MTNIPAAPHLPSTAEMYAASLKTPEACTNALNSLSNVTSIFLQMLAGSKESSALKTVYSELQVALKNRVAELNSTQQQSTPAAAQSSSHATTAAASSTTTAKTALRGASGSNQPASNPNFMEELARKLKKT